MDDYKNTRPTTVVEDQGLCFSPCGYCKSTTRTSAACGLWARSLSVYDYEGLINQTWRRSGMFLYRPDMEKTCCPAYTIRLMVDSFKKSKEHIRVLKRMQRYLDGAYTSRHSQKDMQDGEQEGSLVGLKSTGYVLDGISDRVVEQRLELSSMIGEAIRDCILCNEYPSDLDIPNVIVHCVAPSARKKIKIVDGEICYTCNVAFRCAAVMLKESRYYEYASNICEQYNEEKGKLTHGVLSSAISKSIALRLGKFDELKTFRVEASNGHVNFLFEKDAASKSCCQVPASKTKPESKQVDSTLLENVCAKHKLEICLVRSAFDMEEFELYKRYQTSIHHERSEDVTEAIYRKFLVDTPLVYIPPSSLGVPPCGYGSFHQRYLIDDCLVAVGVVDILPSGLSSNYFFWDPDLEFLSLGKYSALQEIAWVQQIMRTCPFMTYYYLGHYIHSCPKMHYKVSFCPSELLCPVNLKWVHFDTVRHSLDRQPYSCLSDLSVKEDKGSTEDMEVVSFTSLDQSDCKSTIIRTPTWLKIEPMTEPHNIGNVGVALLKLGDLYLRLQALNFVPQDSMDTLVANLCSYAKNVGLSLAGRMAYALD